MSKDEANTESRDIESVLEDETILENESIENNPIDEIIPENDDIEDNSKNEVTPENKNVEKTPKSKLNTVHLIVGIIAAIFTTIASIVTLSVITPITIREHSWIRSSIEATNGSYDNKDIEQSQESPTLVTIEYNANGGISPPRSFEVQVGTYGNRITFEHPASIPTRVGHQFVGWLLNNYSGAMIHNPSDIISFTIQYPDEFPILRYYAQWEKVD